MCGVRIWCGCAVCGCAVCGYAVWCACCGQSALGDLEAEMVAAGADTGRVAELESQRSVLVEQVEALYAQMEELEAQRTEAARQVTATARQTGIDGTYEPPK